MNKNDITVILQSGETIYWPAKNLGPESTGKTTLGKELARSFNIIFVPEYGRIYTETFGPDVNAADIQKIVKGHLASVKAAKKQSNYFLIEDTDPILSGVWEEMLCGTRNEWFDKFKDYADLYLLCDVDIPWVDDGTRYFKNDEDRRRFFELCERELIKRRVRYVKISGTKNKRLAAAANAIFENIG